MKYECCRCGACCTDLQPLTTEEIVMIRTYVKEKKIKDRQKDVTKCPFLRQRRCAIYKVRPIICRLYSCQKKGNAMIRDLRSQIGVCQIRSMRAEVFPHRSA